VYAGKPTKIGDSVHKLPIFVIFWTIFPYFRFLGFLNNRKSTKVDNSHKNRPFYVIFGQYLQILHFWDFETTENPQKVNNSHKSAILCEFRTIFADITFLSFESPEHSNI